MKQNNTTVLIIAACIVAVGFIGYFGFARTTPSSDITASLPPQSNEPTTLPAPVTPVPVTSPASTSTIMVTQADNATTVSLVKGQRFGIAMGDTLEWSLTFDPTGIVTRVTNISTIRGEQGVYTATNTGTTVLHATGAPICNPGEACPQFRQAVTVTLVVR